jgi:hypothetical protein
MVALAQIGFESGQSALFVLQTKQSVLKGVVTEGVSIVYAAQKIQKSRRVISMSGKLAIHNHFKTSIKFGPGTGHKNNLS